MLAGAGAEPSEPASLSLVERRERLVETVRRTQFASVADLSAAFGVSEVTIRNDLDVLAEQGRLRRVRGGAVHSTTTAREAPFEEAQGARAAAKEAIAAAAATLVESGQTVILDSGPTAAAVARALVLREGLEDVTVFTNGLRVALELEPAIPRLTIMLTGGTLRRMQHSLVNPFGTTMLEQVHAHVAILECEGVDPSAGFTHVNVPEVEVKRLMMRAARQRVVVADGSRVGQVSLVHLYSLAEIDTLVTDPSAERGMVDGLREHGLDVHVTG